MATDIVRSVIAPTWTEIGQLGAIVVIRTCLNSFLKKDFERAGERTTAGLAGARESFAG